MPAGLRPFLNRLILSLIFFLGATPLSFGQHKIALEVVLDTLNTELTINQEMLLVNATSNPLNAFYFLDWANSFSDKTSPLGQRFAENFEASFHFEKDEDRGRTRIENWTINGEIADYERSAIDQIKLNLAQALMPGDSIKAQLRYKVKIPKDKYTRFGVDNKGNYHIKYWWITPAAFDQSWVVYSNKNLDDFVMAPVQLKAKFQYPVHLGFKTDLDSISAEMVSLSSENSIQSIRANYQGKRQDAVPLHWFHKPEFQVYQTKHLSIITDFDLKKVLLK